MADGRAYDLPKGWRVLAAAMLGNAIFALPPYTFGLFISPLSSAFGWTRTAVSAGLMVMTVSSAITAPFAGRLIDRRGPQLVIGGGIAAFAACFLALAALPAAPVAFWAIMMFMALGTGCSPVTLSRVLVGNFDRQRGTALGISLLGVGLASVLAPPLLGYVIAHHGWRIAYLEIGLTLMALLPVIVALLPRQSPGASYLARLVTPAIEAPNFVGRVFLLLAVGTVCASLALGGFVAHLVPMLIDAGISPSHAAGWAGLLGMSVMSSRLLTGLALDWLPVAWLAACLFGTGAAAFGVVAALGPGSWILLGPAIGLCLGAELDLIAFLVSRLLPPGCFGRAFGWIYMTFLLGLGLSPVALGWLREMAGTYTPGLWASAFLLVIAALSFGLLPHEISRRADQNPLPGTIRAPDQDCDPGPVPLADNTMG